MGSQRNQREDGEGGGAERGQSLSSSHVELSGGTEPRRKVETGVQPGRQQHCPLPNNHHLHQGSLDPLCMLQGFS